MREERMEEKTLYRYPAESDPDELTTICEACPVAQLIEMIR